jgi:uncharacterized protein
LVGRARPVWIGAVALSTVVLSTVGAVAASGQPYTMATAILPSLLAAYTMATLLHLYGGVQRAQAAGLDRRQAVDRAVAETRRPGAYNVLTTGAGLLSLLLVPIPPIQVFGVAGAVGTLVVFVTVYGLVPPLLLRFDTRPWPRRGSGMGLLGRLASRMAIGSMRRPKTVVVVTALLCIAAVPLVLDVKVESDITAFFKPSHAVSQDTRLIESKLSGVTSLEISVLGNERDSLQDVGRLRAIREFQAWLEQLPEVDRTVSVADLVEEMHWAMNGEKAAYRALPDNNRLLRQYLLVYDGRDLFEMVDREYRHGRIVVSLNVHGTQGIGQVIDQVRQRVRSHPLPGLAVDVGGQGRLFADQADLLVRGQIKSFTGAFVQIFLLMWLLWRSPSASALCMVPNLAPLFFVFVLMGATSIALDLATVMIASIVLGITIDDTIHLYHGYRQRRQAGASTVFAIARSFESAGRAVLATSVLLISQFTLLATSDFLPTANFGLMTAVGLAAGQFFDMVLLPALLLLKDGRERKRSTAPHGGNRHRPAMARVTPAPLPQRRILMCRGRACNAAGAGALWQQLRDQREQLRNQRSGLMFARTSCLGPCKLAPVLQVYPEDVYYCEMDADGLDRVMREHLVGGRVVTSLASPGSAEPRSRWPDTKPEI